ncbi:MAG: hypothetical protein M0R46_11695 [Candidatus Muirbacterium halophilum]|nr:hypothetical protein [Candidatus Muirbacterium halophilum]
MRDRTDKVRNVRKYMCYSLIALCLLVSFGYVISGNGGSASIWAFNSALWGFNLYMVLK